MLRGSPWVRIAGIHLRVPEWGAGFSRRLVYGGRYEAAERQLLAESLRPDDRVLEIGTGLGFIATLCCRVCGSDAVTTVEANERLVPCIEETFRRNAVAPRLLRGLVGRDGETREFHACDCFLGSSTSARGLEGRTVSLPQIPLQRLLSEHLPTYLIMDMEGGEGDLAGMPIAACVRKVLIEFHGQVVGKAGTRAVEDWLVAEGFSPVGRMEAVGLYARDAERARCATA